MQTSVEPLIREAVLQIQGRNYADAAQTLARAAAIAPAHPDVLAFGGVALYGLGELAQGAKAFERALAHAPERGDIVALWDSIRAKPYLRLSTALQSRHAPRRQVFMSAAVDRVSRPGETLRILEVGSYMGASLLTWANALHRLHDGPASILCVDSWSADARSPYPELTAALTSDQAFEVFCHNAEVAKRHAEVRHIRGMSAEVLPTLTREQFDIVYIDACHYYREALADIRESMRLVREGGILCGDDLELQAGACDLQHARANQVTDFIHDPATGTGYHPGVTLAVYDAFGPVSCFDGFWAMQKVGERFEPVSFATARAVLPPHWPAEDRSNLESYFATSSEIAALV